MSTTLDDLVAQAERLSPEERLLLVERLQETLAALDPDVEAAWKMEVERRVAAIETGQENVIPWATAKKTLGL